jgi:hypothetical protein
MTIRRPVRFKRKEWSGKSNRRVKSFGKRAIRCKTLLSLAFEEEEESLTQEIQEAYHRFTETAE